MFVGSLWNFEVHWYVSTTDEAGSPCLVSCSGPCLKPAGFPYALSITEWVRLQGATVGSSDPASLLKQPLLEVMLW